MRRLLIAAAAVVAWSLSAAAQPRVPTIDQILELRRPGPVAISPDGSRVAYVVTKTNWDENAYETEIFMVGGGGGEPVQLTRGRKSSSAPAWSPDGKWIAFISDRTDKRQLYLISPAGGEALPVTQVEEGVNAFRWSPDGKSIAFTMVDA